MARKQKKVRKKAKPQRKPAAQRGYAIKMPGWQERILQSQGIQPRQEEESYNDEWHEKLKKPGQKGE